MKVAMIGCGKLGLPCVLAMESKGHEVVGYDPNPAVAGYVQSKHVPYQEPGTDEFLQTSKLKMVTIAEAVQFAEIIFVAVQTPHHPMYEGTTRVPETRVDFDYSYLKEACTSINAAVEQGGKSKVVVVISTVMPGTVDREIKPLLGPLVQLCYNPYFIAMSTTIQDFLHPEFVLFGVDSEEAAAKAESFYKTIHDKAFFKTTIKNAEAIKVLYNTAITCKIELANTIMEVSHKTGVDCDAVVDALQLATDRIVSTRYMRGGMADSGGCHPRDLIALSWLERNLDIKSRWFDKLIEVREKQTEWLADLIEAHRVNESDSTKLPVFILGQAYKPEVNLTNGSGAILLDNILKERGIQATTFDPWINIDNGAESVFLRTSFQDGWASSAQPSLFFIGINHKVFQTYKFPMGSVVLDPFRYIADQPGVKIIRIGSGA